MAANIAGAAGDKNGHAFALQMRNAMRGNDMAQILI